MKRLIPAVALLLYLISVKAYGQSLLPYVEGGFIDESGNPLNGGAICTTISGTASSNLATYPTYADAVAQTNANANPVVLDAAGRASIWIRSGPYRIVVYKKGSGALCNGSAVGTLVKSVDGVASGISVINAITINGRQMCDQYPGSTAGAKIAACIAALPTTGGIADANGLQGAQVLSSDPLGSVTKPVQLLISGATFTQSVPITVPVNVSLVFSQGAVINVSNTSLTINGPVDAGLRRIFSWSGTSPINFVSGGNMRSVLEVPVEWFGCTDANTSTDDGPCINKAIASVDNNEGVVRLAKKQYCVGTPLTGASFSMKGEGLTQLITNGAGGTSCANMGNADFLTVTGGRQGLDFRDFGIYGTATQQDGIDMTGETGWRWSNLVVNGFTRAAAACYKITSSFSGNFYDGVANTCTRGIEVQRGAEGSGGVSIYGFHSSDISARGLSIVASTAVSCFNCELNVYGASGVGAYIVGSASAKQIGVTLSGGLYLGAQYGIQIGDAGTLAVEGVSIIGALISGCGATTDTCTVTSGLTSAGVLITSGLASGLDISGNHIQLTGSAIRTTGTINKEFVLGSNVTESLVAPAYYLNENGTQVTDVDGTDLNGRPFVSGQCNHVFVSGTSSFKCGYPSMRLYSNATAVGNVGGGADTLMTYTIPAGFFDTGRVMKLEFWGDTAANGNNKTITCSWGAQVLATQGATAANAKPWTISATLIGGSGAAQIKVNDQAWNGASVINTTLTFGGNISDARDIACTGLSGSSTTDDIVQRGMSVTLAP